MHHAVLLALGQRGLLQCRSWQSLEIQAKHPELWLNSSATDHERYHLTNLAALVDKPQQALILDSGARRLKDHNDLMRSNWASDPGLLPLGFSKFEMLDEA